MASVTLGQMDAVPVAVSASTATVEPFPLNRLVKIAQGLRWGEGPVFDAVGRLYFTDHLNDRIYRWTGDGSQRGTLPGKLEVVTTGSGGAVGLALDAAGGLWACEASARRLTRWTFESGDQISRAVMVTTYGGRRFTGPNDMWVDARGGVYFSDTRFWSRTASPQGGYYVYYLHPGTGLVSRVSLRHAGPNGLAGSPDGRWLYVVDLPARAIYRYAIDPQTGSLSDRTLFARRTSDGIRVDPLTGDLYAAGAGGVAVYGPDGLLKRSIQLGVTTVSLALGSGPLAGVLFVTTPTAVFGYRVTDSTALA